MYPSERVKQLVTVVADQVREHLGSGRRVIWFGSWVRGTASVNSDIDLAVGIDGEISPTDYARLLEWIDEDLPTLYRVDLVNLNEVAESFRSQILNEGVLV